MNKQIIETPVGCLQAVWSSEEKLLSCGFIEARAVSEQNTHSRTRQVRPTERERLLVERLENYFQCGTLEWELELLDWSEITPFHSRVLRACHAIPAGETLSYAELAARAGSPRGARAVGGAMARNRWPLIIPCHRVVGASGHLTGYSGTGGVETKRHLLDLESLVRR